MKETKRISLYMLELYNYDAVTKKERKLIEAAMATDDELRLRYEEIKKSDQELSKLYPTDTFPALKVIKNDNVKETNIISKNRKLLWKIGIAAILLCVLIPPFIYFSRQNSKNIIEIATEPDKELEYNIEERENINNQLVIDETRIIDEHRVIIVENNMINDEMENIAVAVLPNPETGVFVRGGSENQEQPGINIPAGMTFIFDSMFSDRQLTDITIPERITFIGNNAFANNLLRNVIIPDNITSIGSYAFGNNPLLSITIGANVYLDDDAIPGDFAHFYNINGKAAGTYTRQNTTSYVWRME
jgi:hypothetical protein